MTKKTSQTAKSPRRARSDELLKAECDHVADSGLAQTLDSFVEPAYLLNGMGALLFTNEAARKAFAEPPLWLRVITQISDVSTRDRLALITAIRFRGRSLVLVQPKSTAPPEADDMRVIRLLGALPLELHNVAELMLKGLSDRMIARCTSQSDDAVRAQVSTICRQLGVSNRQELSELGKEKGPSS